MEEQPLTLDHETAAVGDDADAVCAQESAFRVGLLRSAIPALQSQEGCPANTFSLSELEQQHRSEVMRELNNVGSSQSNLVARIETAGALDVFNPKESEESTENDSMKAGESSECKNTIQTNDLPNPILPLNKRELESQQVEQEKSWFGALTIPSGLESQHFRQLVRQGMYNQPTNGVCPGFLQCNLVVLPQGPLAFDFLLFCQRNKKACPLIEVCDIGSPFPIGVARDADLRTDIPKYAIYRDGVLDKEVDNVMDEWPENSVAFLIGCSFSYDGEFLDAGIPLRSAELGRNVPMYKTALPCRSAGALWGNMVVSMKPIPALQVAKEVEITSRYPHAHGSPVSVGSSKSIGIENLENPDWGEAIDVGDDEVPVFHACGVTPQVVLMNSKVPFAITHSAGYMFVTDLPSNTAI